MIDLEPDVIIINKWEEVTIRNEDNGNMRMKAGLIMEGEGTVSGKSNDKRWTYHTSSNL